jgi:hypothetical protein
MLSIFSLSRCQQINHTTTEEQWYLLKVTALGHSANRTQMSHTLFPVNKQPLAQWQCVRYSFATAYFPISQKLTCSKSPALNTVPNRSPVHYHL